MGDSGTDRDLPGYQTPESKAIAAMESRLADLEERLGVLEGRRTDQIGFHHVEGTWPVGNVPDGMSNDDDERQPHMWVGDAGAQEANP